jgi:hypothetical protein
MIIVLAAMTPRTRFEWFSKDQMMLLHNEKIRGSVTRNALERRKNATKITKY